MRLLKEGPNISQGLCNSRKTNIKISFAVYIIHIRYFSLYSFSIIRVIYLLTNLIKVRFLLDIFHTAIHLCNNVLYRSRHADINQRSVNIALVTTSDDSVNHTRFADCWYWTALWFYEGLNKNSKIHRSEKSFTALGSEDRCSSRGLWYYWSR